MQITGKEYNTIFQSQHNDVFTRNYDNDWSITESQANTWLETAQRIVFVALPFLALNKSLQAPIAIGSSLLRVWNMTCNLSAQENWSTIYRIFHTGLSVGALAAAIFDHPIGLLLTTSQDLIIEVNHLLEYIEDGNIRESLTTALKIVSDVLYITLLLKGGLELCVLSLALQSIVLLVSSVEEFGKGRYLEGAADLLLGAIRAKHGLEQYELLKRKWAIEEAIKRIPADDLHERWQFLSDHLPVGVEVEGVRILSWNVLNNAYMGWVLQDSQGLNGSLITELNEPIGNTGLTKRDKAVIDIITSMTNNGQIIALQECGEPFLQALKQSLPQGWQMVKSFDTPKTNQEVFLFDTSKLAYNSDLSETSSTAYSNSLPTRPLQQGTFSVLSSDNKTSISVINGHIPGDPLLPGRFDFANYVADTYKNAQQDRIVVALGDNNFEWKEMSEAYQSTGLKDYTLHVPYNTNIDPYTKTSKAIDLICVIGSEQAKTLRGQEVLQDSGFKEVLHLLNGTGSSY